MELERLRSALTAEAIAVHGHRVLAEPTRLSLRRYAPPGAGDLDTFVTGVCDGLMALKLWITSRREDQGAPVIRDRRERDERRGTCERVFHWSSRNVPIACAASGFRVAGDQEQDQVLP